jgi:hypothetical protein
LILDLETVHHELDRRFGPTKMISRRFRGQCGPKFLSVGQNRGVNQQHRAIVIRTWSHRFVVLFNHNDKNGPTTWAVDGNRPRSTRLPTATKTACASRDLIASIHRSTRGTRHRLRNGIDPHRPCPPYKFVRPRSISLSWVPKSFFLLCSLLRRVSRR